MREQVFWSNGRVFHHAKPGTFFELSDNERDVYLDNDTGYGCKVTVPLEDLSLYHAGGRFKLVRLPGGEDLEALRAEDV